MYEPFSIVPITLKDLRGHRNIAYRFAVDIGRTLVFTQMGTVQTETLPLEYMKVTNTLTTF